MVDYIFEQGESIQSGEHGETDYVFASGNPIPNSGNSSLVFESGVGIGGTVDTGIIADWNHCDLASDGWVDSSGTFSTTSSPVYEGNCSLEITNDFGEWVVKETEGSPGRGEKQEWYFWIQDASYHVGPGVTFAVTEREYERRVNGHTGAPLEGVFCQIFDDIMRVAEDGYDEVHTDYRQKMTNLPENEWIRCEVYWATPVEMNNGANEIEYRTYDSDGNLLGEIIVDQLSNSYSDNGYVAVGSGRNGTAAYHDYWRITEVNEAEPVENYICSAGGDGYVHKIDSTDGSLIWEYNLGSSVFDIANDGNYIYAGGTNNSIDKINASTGEQVWVYEDGYTIRGIEADDSGFIYYTSDNEQVVKLDVETQTEEWVYNFGGQPTTLEYDNGYVYVGGETTTVHKIDASTGSKVWTKGISENGYIYTISARYGAVYVGGAWRSTLYKLDASTGDVSWTTSNHNNDIRSIDVGDSSTVFTGGRDYRVISNGTSQGSSNWKNQIHSGSVESVASFDGGNVYSGGSDDVIYKHNASDGSQEWSYSGHSGTIYAIEIKKEATGPIDPNIHTFWSDYMAIDKNTGNTAFSYTDMYADTDPDVSGGVAYFTAHTGNDPYPNYVTAFDATDGTQLYETQLPESGYEDITAIFYEGIYYVIDTDDALHAVDGSDGSILWSTYIDVNEDSYDTPRAMTVANGKLFVAGKDTDYILCLDKSDGSKIWKTGGDGAYSSYSRAVYIGDTLYYGDGDGYINAIDPADGSTIWTSGQYGYRCATPVYSDGNFYFHCEGSPSSAGLVSIDSNGNHRWTQSDVSASSYAPVVGSDRVYAGAQDNGNGQDGFFAVSKSDGSVIWSQGSGNWDRVPMLTENAIYGVDAGTDEIVKMNKADGTESWRATGQTPISEECIMDTWSIPGTKGDPLS